MAGDFVPVINKWFLDYLCFISLEEFKKDKTLSSCTVDLISGIVEQNWEGDERVQEKKLFLTVLSRIKDGQNISERYEEREEDLTPLEDLLPLFNNLIMHQIDDTLVEEGERLMKVIRTEAVLVCIHLGEFGKAKEVFDRVLQGPQYKNDKVIKRIKNVVEEKNTELNMTYDDFLCVILAYLTRIAENFEEPLLIKAAHSLKQRQPCAHKTDKAEDSAHRKHPRRNILEGVKDKTNHSDNNNHQRNTDKEKLRKLWDKSVKEMFGSPDRGKPSTSVEPMRREGTPEDKGQPLDNTIPVICESPSHSSTPNGKAQPTFKSPGSPVVQYKKNFGRENRHRPVMSSTRCSDIDDNASIKSDLTVGGSRKRKWTNDEMVEFFEAVQVIGVGKWSQIKDYLDTSRTGVMLKDKWRNMVKSGDLKKLEDARKPVKKS